MFKKLFGKLFGEIVTCRVMDRSYQYEHWHSDRSHEQDQLTTFLKTLDGSYPFTVYSTNTDGIDDYQHEQWSKLREGDIVNVLVRKGSIRKLVA